MALRYGDDIIVIDAGMMFPEAELLGVDVVIPDISYLLENRQHVRAILLTHGHEDHIGALPFILGELNVPVYGTPFTLALVEGKLDEHGLLGTSQFREVRPTIPGSLLQPIVEASQKLAPRLRVILPRVLAVENDRHHRIAPLGQHRLGGLLDVADQMPRRLRRRHARIHEPDQIGNRVIAKHQVHRRRAVLVAMDVVEFLP